MRLFNVRTLKLQEFGNQAPPYAIASHRWSGEEADFIDVVTQQNTTTRGYEKVKGFAAFVHKCTTLDWLWIDTVCIDRGNASELHDAINSMFKWYRNAEICIAYLEDVHSKQMFGARRVSPKMTNFVQSTWFNRGWTLQELLAPNFVLFVTQTWEVIGSKGNQNPYFRGRAEDLHCQIASATKLPVEVLGRYEASLRYSTDQKLAWATDRTTTQPEDMAYCMLGLLGVRMSIAYGEGARNAQKRLLAAVHRHERTPKRLGIPSIAAENLHVERTLLSIEFAQHMSQVQSGTRSSHIVAVVGPCGAGKTQLVSRFLEQHRESYPTVFWFDARNMVTLRESVAVFHRTLGSNTSTQPDRYRTEHHPAIRYMLSWLHDRTREQRWVVVFDNINDNFDVSRIIPHGQAGIVIMIGRSREAVTRGLSADQQNNIVVVPMMLRSEAQALFSKAVFHISGGQLDPTTGPMLHSTSLGLIDLCDRFPTAITILASVTCTRHLSKEEAQREVRKFLRRAQYDGKIPPTLELAGQRLDAGPLDEAPPVSQFESVFERLQQVLFSRDLSETMSEGSPGQSSSVGDWIRASDSGYGSGGGSRHGDKFIPVSNPTYTEQPIFTDSERINRFSIYTDGEDSGAKATEQKAKFSAAFAARLADCFRDAPIKLTVNPSTAVYEIETLLSQYARLIRATTSKPYESKASVFVRHHRSVIAHGFTRQVSKSEEIAQTPMSLPSEIMLSTAKLDDWDIDPSGTSDEPPDIPSDLSLEYDEQEKFQFSDQELGDLEELKSLHPNTVPAEAFLCKSPEWDWLISSIAAQLGDSDTRFEWAPALELKRIRESLISRLTNSLPSKPEVALSQVLDVDWQPVEYLCGEYGSSQLENSDGVPSLKDDIILCGEWPNSQLFTCEEYVLAIWPGIGPQVLAIVDDVVRCTYLGTEPPSRHEFGDQSTIETKLEGNARFSISGRALDIVQAAEVIIWLGAACRSSGANITMCKPTMSLLPNESIGISYTNEDIPYIDQNGACWIQMVRNPTIASGFPVYVRPNDEAGVELDVHLLLALSRTREWTRYKDYRLLKGTRTMLVPNVVSSESVMWHFMVEKQDPWLSWETISSCENVVSVCEDDIITKRHFVGWASDARVTAGTDARCIEYRAVGESNCANYTTNPSLGTIQLSVSQIVGGQVSFKLGRKLIPIYFSTEEDQDPNSYHSQINAASTWPTMLFDVKLRRGWLVDGASAALYMMRIWSYENSRFYPGADIPATQFNLQSSAREILLNRSNRNITVIPADPDNPSSTATTWEHRVLRQLRRIREIKRHLSESRESDDMEIGFRDVLAGPDLAELACEEDLPKTYRRSIHLSSRAHRWLKMIREKQIPCLLGSYLGELIQPTAVAAILCRNQPSSLPVDQDLLAVPVNMIDLMTIRQRDHPVGHVQITKSTFLQHPFPGLQTCNRVACVARKKKDRREFCPHAVTKILSSPDRHVSRGEQRLDWRRPPFSREVLIIGEDAPLISKMDFKSWFRRRRSSASSKDEAHLMIDRTRSVDTMGTERFIPFSTDQVHIKQDEDRDAVKTPSSSNPLKETGTNTSLQTSLMTTLNRTEPSPTVESRSTSLTSMSVHRTLSQTQIGNLPSVKGLGKKPVRD